MQVPLPPNASVATTVPSLSAATGVNATMQVMPSNTGTPATALPGSFMMNHSMHPAPVTTTANPNAATVTTPTSAINTTAAAPSNPTAPNHHPLQRLQELIDSLQRETHHLLADWSTHTKRQDLEQKLFAQVNELSLLQKTVFELERSHQRMKQGYEEEVARLRRELELLKDTNNGSNANNNANAAAASVNNNVNKRPRNDSNGTNATPAVHRQEGADWVVLSNNNANGKTMPIQLLYSFDHSSVVCSVRFSRKGNYLATGCNRLTQVYDTETGTCLAQLNDTPTETQDLYIRSVAFDCTGERLATGAEDRVIRVWSWREKKCLFQFTGHEQDIYALEFSPVDEKILVSGSGDHTVRVWDVERGVCLHVLEEKSNNANSNSNNNAATATSSPSGITSIAISPNGKFVAAGSLDRMIRVWQLETGQCWVTYQGHLDAVYAVSFSPDGHSLLTGSLDRTLKVWSFDETHPSTSLVQSPVLSCPGHKDFVLSVAYSRQGIFLSGSKDRTVQFWDARTGQSLLTLQGHKNSVIGVSVQGLSEEKANSNTLIFATGSGDCRARVWSLTLDQ